MFKVGDKVVGTKAASCTYAITVEGWVGIVKKLHSNGRAIDVVAVEGDFKDESFQVDFEYFELLEEPKVEEPEVVYITNSLYA